MKRGIFRIIAGIIMISLQVLSMMALTSAGIDYTFSDNIDVNSIFYDNMNIYTNLIIICDTYFNTFCKIFFFSLFKNSIFYIK